MKPLSDLLKDCEPHLLALSEAIARCPAPVEARHFSVRDADLVAALDQFAYRFTRLQDVMIAYLCMSINAPQV